MQSGITSHVLVDGYPMPKASESVISVAKPAEKTQGEVSMKNHLGVALIRNLVFDGIVLYKRKVDITDEEKHMQRLSAGKWSYVVTVHISCMCAPSDRTPSLLAAVSTCPIEKVDKLRLQDLFAARYPNLSETSKLPTRPFS